MNTEEIVGKLKDLRIKWKNTTDPTMKKVIERQGRALKRALEETGQDIIKSAERIFGVKAKE